MSNDIPVVPIHIHGRSEESSVIVHDVGIVYAGVANIDDGTSTYGGSHVQLLSAEVGRQSESIETTWRTPCRLLLLMVPWWSISSFDQSAWLICYWLIKLFNLPYLLFWTLAHVMDILAHSPSNPTHILTNTGTPTMKLSIQIWLHSKV